MVAALHKMTSLLSMHMCIEAQPKAKLKIKYKDGDIYKEEGETEGLH